MKVLILTNSNYKEFIGSLVDGIKGVAYYWGDERYMFHGGEEYDIGISFMYQYKVPAKEVNTYTWFNFHPAPLPEYKGRNLCYHAIINGEKEFGATVHYMDENFDTGDIIEVFKFMVAPDDTAETLSEFTIKVSKKLFERYFPLILRGERFERHPNVGGTYYSKTEIDDYIGLTDYQDRKLRAITYKEFYPKIDAGGRIYKVIPE